MIQDEKKLRNLFVEKYVKELSQKTGKSQQELLAHGLSAYDLKDIVSVVYEDGSNSNYRYAFFIENKENYAVFTEHCGYHEFKKIWLEKIEVTVC